MLNVAICDDNAVERATVVALAQETFQRRDVETAVTEFSNPVDLLACIQDNGPFDLILCDVYMPGLLGTEAIEELRAAGDETHVVFLTTSRDHAVDAFALHADGYLVKPLESASFESMVGRCVDEILQEQAANLVIKGRDGIVRVMFSDMLYAASAGNYQTIYLRDGSEVESRITGRELFSMLEHDERFYRLGASFVVNMDEVRSVEGRKLLLTNGEQLTIPTRQAKTFSDAFFDHVMKAVN